LGKKTKNVCLQQGLEKSNNTLVRQARGGKGENKEKAITTVTPTLYRSTRGELEPDYRKKIARPSATRSGEAGDEATRRRQQEIADKSNLIPLEKLESDRIITKRTPSQI